MNETICDILKITPREIKRWTEENAVDSILPEIIKDLVLASSSRLTRCNFLYGSCNNLPGLDGHVENQQEHPFVPIGESYWEIGCESSANSKANKDYVKRTRETEPELRKQLTFVFVSPQIWKNRQKWETEKKQKKEWHDVRAISAVQLAEWINLYPSQQLNFAQRIKRWYPGATTLETEWYNWTHATKPNFPESFFSTDISKYKSTFIKWIKTNSPKTLTIAADSYAEAYAFIYIMANENELSSIKNRMIIFHSAESAAYMMKKEPRIIPISDNGDVLSVAISTDEEAHCIQICTKNHPVLKPDIILERLPFQAVVEFDKANKHIGVDLFSLAKECGFNRSFYHQKLHFPPLVPPWVKESHAHSILLVLAMMGYWDETDNTQTAYFIELTGGHLNSKAIHDTLTQISNQEHSPICKYRSIFNREAGSIWYAISPPEILERLVQNNINASLIRAWFRILFSLLSPSGGTYSNKLIKQFIDTTVHLSIHAYDWIPTLAHLIYTESTSVVSSTLELLSTAPTSRMWEHLTSIVEIEPKAFLTWLDEQNKDQLFLLLQQSSLSFNGIMNCLTMIAVPSTYYKTIIRHLCKFASLAIDPIIRARICDTISALLDATFPGSRASISQKLQAFNFIKNQHPELIWDITIRIADPYVRKQPFYHTSDKRGEEWERPCSYRNRDAYDMYHLAITTLCSVSKWDYQQASHMCQLLRLLDINNQQKVWRKLAEHIHDWTQEERYDLYLRAENLLEIHEKSNDFDHKSARQFLWRCSQAINNFRIIHIFSYSLHRRFYLFMHQIPQYNNLKRAQQHLLKRHIQHNPDIILEIIKQNDTNHSNLAAAVRISLSDAEIQTLTHYCLSSESSGKERNFLSALLEQSPPTELRKRLLNSLATISDQQRLAFLLQAPVVETTWELINKEYPHLRLPYWQQCEPCLYSNFNPQKETMLAYLIDANRLETALECCHIYLKKVSTRTLTRMLGLLIHRQTVTSFSFTQEAYIADTIIHLQERSDIHINKLARIEIHFANIIGSHNIGYKALPLLLRTNPDFVAALGKKLEYRSVKSRLLQLDQLHITLEQVTPFFNSDIETEELFQWCDSIINHHDLEESSKDRILGCLLANGNEYNISSWLSPALIQAIERYYTPELESHFCIAVSNQSNRARVCAYDEKGIRERECVAQLRELAAIQRTKQNFFTAKIINRLADSMATLASFHDELCII